MTSGPNLVVFRRDLRVSDNAALHAAVAEEGPVLPVYVLDDRPERPWRPGRASRWWLHHSLDALSDSLKERGASLLLRHGPWAETVADLAIETGAKAVLWSRLYEPATEAEDAELTGRLQAAGIRARRFSGYLLHEPETVRTRSGTYFQVFTPFWRAANEALHLTRPLPAPERIQALAAAPPGLALEDLRLHPGRSDWSDGLAESWQPGEAAAQEQLQDFLADGVDRYHVTRDRPELPGTSRLSPYLHFGEISPRQIWHAVRGRRQSGAGPEAFLRELGWREFSHHLLMAFPDLPDRPLRREFAAFPWAEDEEAYRAWTGGRTGFPIVDAGMRQLRQTGWMHNRVRMIVASFLVKDLLLPWSKGEAWFWDSLVDADLANNAASWQWVAGCGADAAPYFRVFNPVLQGEKFDPRGRYVRQWLPELAKLPDLHIHRPWNAPSMILAEAGVALGRTYPRPIVDHGAARRRALNAYEEIRSRGAA
ncbi:deoxyribodipyrimidine photo-lyase [Telmatospirillum sp. J64-1]|uniref:cryptochrome/photolyase family protein n=1 Tax=Telmatospirillum sp. J64-1 TaxID=2502183 RepID=UPI00115EC19A|nr:deoxyribodipyrimidine photo-lyase [Telmatospirillum sp. J64-1]